MMGSAQSREMTPLLEAVEVSKTYRVQAGWGHYASIPALEGVSVQAWQGRTLAIAGESGCGKSTLGRVLLGLVAPDEGETRYVGRPMSVLPQSHWQDFHRSVQMVFQNPLASFNPMFTVGGTVTDAMRLRNDLPCSSQRREEAERLMAELGLEPSLLDHYPSQMSAGQLQKASMARALATRPRMVFLDEPTSALDASGRRQIIDLLLTLQSQLDLGYVLVSHDFHVIRRMAHYVVVMYLGQVVEEGPAAEVFRQPFHPYTRALLAASYVESARQSPWRLRGELSKLPADYQGCRLLRRCAFALSGCQEMQPLVSIRPQHRVRCCRAEEILTDAHDSGTEGNPH